MRDQVRQIEIIPGLPIELVLVEGGKYKMGDDLGKSEKSKPTHDVEVTTFYLSKYQVTQRQWKAVMGNNPSRFMGDNHPVEQVTWVNAQIFIIRLNELTGNVFRLPTDTEWEYAARGGLYSQGFIYAGSDKLSQVAWYRENSDRTTHDVGLLLGNELNIYDMSGNVWEWCQDDWHDDYTGAPTDSSARNNQLVSRGLRGLRGGSCFDAPIRCRSAYRKSFSLDSSRGVGLRLALSLRSVG